MGSFSIWHWVVVLVVVLVLFGGGGKLSRLMGDMARGITAFKKGLKDGETAKDGSADGSAKESISGAGAAPDQGAGEADKAAKG